jgi:hypothetical protein
LKARALPHFQWRADSIPVSSAGFPLSSFLISHAGRAPPSEVHRSNSSAHRSVDLCSSSFCFRSTERSRTSPQTLLPLEGGRGAFAEVDAATQTESCN